MVLVKDFTFLYDFPMTSQISIYMLFVGYVKVN